MSGDHLKCVLVGQSGLEESKTSLICSFDQQQSEMNEPSTPTMGSCFTQFSIINDEDCVEYQLAVWDTAGQGKYQNMSPMYYRGVNVIIALFSLTDKESLNSLQGCIESARNTCPGVPVILCGTGKLIRDRNDKTLLRNSEKWAPVNTEEGKYMQNKLSSQAYFEVNVSDNLDELFDTAVKLAVSFRGPLNYEEQEFPETMSKNGIDFRISYSGEAVVTGVSNETTSIPEKISIKLKKYVITELSFNNFASWPTNELHFHKNSKITTIHNVNLKNVIEMDIPPLLESISTDVIRTAKQLKIINILSPEKNRFKLLNEIFLVNNRNNELVVALKCESAPECILTSVNRILPYAFAYFKVDMSNILGNQITELPSFCYFQSMIRRIVIPDSIEIIGDLCFKECRRLEDIIFTKGSRLKQIRKGAFMGSGIRSFTVAPLVEVIGINAFKECKQLKKFKFQDKSCIDHITSNYFIGCNDDLIIKLPKGFKSLINISKNHLFNLNLEQNQEIVIYGDMICEKQGKRLFYVRNTNQEKLTIPSSIVEMKAGALEDLLSLRELEVSCKVEEFDLGDLPPNVEVITLPKSVTRVIGNRSRLPLKRIVILGNQRVSITCNSLSSEVEIVCNDSQNIIFDKKSNKNKIVSRIEQELKIDFDRLVQVRNLGKGASGDVILMKDSTSGNMFAVKKILCIEDTNGRNKQNFNREISTMKSALHPCIVRFYANTPWETNGEAQIALEFYSGGSLDNFYSGNKLSNTDKVIIFVGICIGMSHLHRNRIIHRDLKPQNVLIDERKHPHIGDFGLSKFDETEVSNTGNIGSLMYMAPELFEGEHCGAPADVYAFGVLAFELLFGTSCFSRNDNFFSIMVKKSNNDHHSIPKEATPLARRIVESMISVDISSRPTFDEVLETVKSENYSLLPDVDIDAVRSYVAEVSSDVGDEDKNEEDRVLGSEDSDFFSFNPIQMSDAIINFDIFENPRLIGRGRSGNVYLMTFKNQDFERDYVVKMRDHSKERGDQVFLREVEILCTASHPCTVRIFGFCFFSSEQEPARIAIEFYEHGTLFDLMNRSIRGERVSEFTPTVKAIIVVGVCYGMRFLHSLDVIHRNLNPKKIFLDSSYRPRIGGFCNSKFFDCENTMTVDGVFNSAAYVAPEASSHDYDSKVDVYSFGLILREISTNRWSNQRERPHSSPIIEGVSSLTAGIIDGCLESDPRRRLSFEDIIEHLKGDNFKLFDGINIEEVLQYAASIEKCENIYINI